MTERKRVFISSRRDDASGEASLIYERFARRLGSRNVFMDVDNLAPGQIFDQELDRALDRCDVLLAIIGTRWLELLSQTTNAGSRDYLREEIARALKRGVTVIPVLVGHEGRMPSLPRAKELPKDICALVDHHKQNVVHENRQRDIDRLIGTIDPNAPKADEPGTPWLKVIAASAIGICIGGGAAWASMKLAYPPAPPGFASQSAPPGDGRIPHLVSFNADKTESQAKSEFAKIKSSHPELFDEMEAWIQRINDPNGYNYRAVLGPLDQRKAFDLCKRAEQAGVKDCWPFACTKM